MDHDGARVRVNRKAQIGWVIGLLIGVLVIFGIVGHAVRENALRPPEVGHSHSHDHGGGGMTVPPDPSGGPSQVSTVTAEEPPAGHEGHDH